MVVEDDSTNLSIGSGFSSNAGCGRRRRVHCDEGSPPRVCAERSQAHSELAHRDVGNVRNVRGFVFGHAAFKDPHRPS